MRGFPSDKHYDVKDEKTRNLIVRVGPENAKGDFHRSFCLVTRFPGSKNPTRHTFGEYKVNGKGDLTLEESRELAAEWRAMIRKNVDPREAERREKVEVNRKRDLTFGSIVEEYLARHVKGQRKAAQVEREIRRGLGDDTPRAGRGLFRTEGACRTSQENLRSNEISELRHRDASKRKRRRIVAQRDPVQCAEGITRGERTRRSLDQRVHLNPATLVTPTAR